MADPREANRVPLIPSVDGYPIDLASVENLSDAATQKPLTYRIRSPKVEPGPKSETPLVIKSRFAG